MSSTPPRRRWRRTAATLTAATVAFFGLAGTALPARAATPPTTTVTVTSASAEDGLGVAVAGTDYVGLPASTTGYAAGVYVAAYPAGTAPADMGTGNTIGGAQFIQGKQIVDGRLSASLSLPASELDAETDYEVAVWPAHGNATDENLIAREAIRLSDAQRTALFPAQDRSVTIKGTDFVNLPASTTGYAAGVYVGLYPAGTRPADMSAGNAVGGAAFIKAADIVDGAFGTTITIPGARADDDLEAVAWPAHGNATDANLISRVRLGASTTVNLTGPGEPEPEPEPEPSEAPAPTETAPAPEPGETTTPNTPSTAVKVSSADAASGLAVDVTGTDYVELPHASTGKPAVGVYAAVIERGMPSTSVTADNASGVAFVYLPAGAAGAFSTTIEVTTDKLAKDGQYDVLIWSAHGDATDDTVIYRKDLRIDDAQRDALFPEPGETTQAPGPSETATQDGSTPGTPPADDATISGATMTWGIKESFRRYVVGPVAHGAWRTTGNITQAGDSGVFTFTQGGGELKDGKGTLTFAGSVNATGHDGQMDLTLSGFRVKITSGTTAQLIVDASAPRSSLSQAIDLKNVVLAELGFDAGRLTLSEAAPGDKATVSSTRLLQLRDAGASLTAAGAPALGGFYEAGTELDAVSINAKASAPRPATTPNDDERATVTPSRNATRDAAAGPGNDDATTPVPGGTPTSASAQCRTVTVPGTAGGVNLSWGVKSSFVSYVKGGIARGTVGASSGAAVSASGFTWGAGSGSLSSAGTGTLSFPGSVRFTGHDGLLDTTLSGLRVQLTGPGTGVLLATVKSQDMEGKDLSGSIRFATLSFSGGSASGFVDAKVTLTAAGARSFAGFYAAGQLMDPLTVTVGASTSATSRTVCGDAATLASTGAAGTEAVVGTAGLLALLGTAIVVAARRRGPARRH